MARTHYIAGNWKMNTSKEEAVALAKDLVAQLKGKTNKFMIGVPFVYLDAVAQVVKGSNIILAAQDCAATSNGAHTGEISTTMLKDVGCRCVILGHSERRHEIGESDELINKKVRKALNDGLEVDLCIGELLAEREAGEAEQVCAFQLSAGLAGVTEDQMKRVTIAYEPVWAIGTGKTACRHTRPLGRRDGRAYPLGTRPARRIGQHALGHQVAPAWHPEFLHTDGSGYRTTCQSSCDARRTGGRTSPRGAQPDARIALTLRSQGCIGGFLPLHSDSRLQVLRRGYAPRQPPRSTHLPLRLRTCQQCNETCRSFTYQCATDRRCTPRVAFRAGRRQGFRPRYGNLWGRLYQHTQPHLSLQRQNQRLFLARRRHGSNY